MELKSGYKRTEVGVIPADWVAHTIGDSMRLFNGRAFRPEDWRDHGLPIIRIQNLNNPASTFNYWSGPVEDRHRIEPGDLLFAWSGTTGTSFGARVWDGPTGVLNQHIFKVIPDKTKLTPSYALLVLREAQELIEKQAHGFKASFVHVKKSDLVCIPLALPPTLEQEAIAEALSDADALIESLEQLLAKKRQLKQGAMQELLTGRKRLPGFSAEWNVEPLGELFEFTGGFTASRDQLSSQGYCYLHYGDIHASRKPFLDVRAEYQSIPKLDVPLGRVSSGSLLGDGDVVFVDASEDDEGTSRHVVIMNPEGIPFISGLHTIVAKSRPEVLAHKYLCHCFQTAAVRAQFRFFAVGTKVSGISKSNIARILLPVPSLPEQTAIATILSDMDAGIAALEAKLTKACQLKQGMMQELLTGRIRLAADESRATE